MRVPPAPCRATRSTESSGARRIVACAGQDFGGIVVVGAAVPGEERGGDVAVSEDGSPWSLREASLVPASEDPPEEDSHASHHSHAYELSPPRAPALIGLRAAI